MRLPEIASPTGAHFHSHFESFLWERNKNEGSTPLFWPLLRFDEAEWVSGWRRAVRSQGYVSRAWGMLKGRKTRCGGGLEERALQQPPLAGVPPIYFPPLLPTLIYFPAALIRQDIRPHNYFALSLLYFTLHCVLWVPLARPRYIPLWNWL